MKLEKILERVKVPLVAAGLSIVLGFVGCTTPETKKPDVKKNTASAEYVGEFDFVSKHLKEKGEDVTWVWHNRVFCMLCDGYYEAAVKYATDLIQTRFSNIPVLYTYRGEARRQLGMLEEALADQNKAIQIIPNNHYAYNRRGRVYEDMGLFDKAMQDYEKALEDDEPFSVYYADINNLKGRIKEKEGKYQEAEIFYARAAATYKRLCYKDDRAEENLKRVIAKMKNE
jgi:tetratricopeptide (TPR) repeat protein